MVSSPPKTLLQLLHDSYSTIQCLSIQSPMLNVKPVSLDPAVGSTDRVKLLSMGVCSSSEWECFKRWCKHFPNVIQAACARSCFEPYDTEALVKAYSGQAKLPEIRSIKETSQELRMLSSVTINCQITKIVMNSGSQLSEF